MIKAVDFFGNKVTRLLIGDNPFVGNSYIKEIYTSDEMNDYYTADNCVRALFEAEANGINTYLALANPFILKMIRQFRNEGGKLNIIFQTYPPMDLEVQLRLMMVCNPIGIYHQGSTFDLMTEENRMDEIHSRLKMIRSMGVKTGFATHVPETVMRSEQEKWDIDFYMTCLYNSRRQLRGQQSGFITGKQKEVVFYKGDQYLMFDAIKKTSKPCIAFKIFAGGQIFIGKSDEEVPKIAEAAIKEAYENIKPSDVICLGVFQKKKNQIKENADMVKRILG